MYTAIDPRAENQGEVRKVRQWGEKKWEGEEGNGTGSLFRLYFLEKEASLAIGLPPLLCLSENARWIGHSYKQMKANILIENTPHPAVSILISVAQC